MRSGTPLVVFPCVACEPTHTNICGPLSKKSSEPWSTVITYSILTHLNSQNALVFKVLVSHKPKTGGTWWRRWLRHCATSQKVAGSIPDGVTGIFHWHNPSGCTMALGSTQPLTEMSTRNISWRKGSPYVGLITLSPSCANCLEIWEPQTPETLRACPGL